ncbi:glycosyltransferase family 4 protein [Streptomyces sp. NPDC047108]|uniref:glycosyltransferase family 4 protein n=1 Tax=Streptomyces sp. NPDC047108 TaxID=3155025 RepID=UPI0033D39994
MKISFLIHNVYGVGGTVRTVVNLAGELAERHDVEIASVFRHRAKPRFDIAPQVRLTPLVDTRPGHDDGHPLAGRPARMFPAGEARHGQYSRLTDERIIAWLARVDADVVIGTRPGLNVMLARYGPRDAVRIAQEHLTYDGHRPVLRDQLRTCSPLLDAFVTVTEADAAAYRARMPDMRVAAIPNGVPRPRAEPSDGTSRVVVAAGRLVPGKRFDRLVDAFAEVVTERPDWTLRIYGRGPHRDAVQARIDHHGLHENVRLMGMHTSMENEWVKGSLAAVSSTNESFGMTIVEAMRAGLPVVSTDCPLGPREIIRQGRNGLLVPVDDTEAFADALLRLINDDEARKRMARSAREGAYRYDPGVVAARHETLLKDLVRARENLPDHHLTATRHRIRAARATVSYVMREFLFRAGRSAKRKASRIRGGGTSP